MRIILALLPALVCAGAMLACGRMLVRRDRSADTTPDAPEKPNQLQSSEAQSPNRG